MDVIERKNSLVEEIEQTVNMINRNNITQQVKLKYSWLEILIPDQRGRVTLNYKLYWYPTFYKDIPLLV